MTLQEAIQKLVARQDLRESEACAVAELVMSGQATQAQIGALLVALRMKGETVDEITGLVRAMRAGAAAIRISHPDDLLDTCGTGGDGLGTFNVSTAVAFVAAGAGCRVAKHGNRSNLSRAGSADVLTALGVDIQMPPEHSAACIEKLGIVFLFAPQYHPGARHAAGPRRELGIRTIFNTLGPLVHPAGARRQVLGTYDGALTEAIAHVLRRLGSIHCLVVHGEDGLDELTLSGPTRVSELREGAVRSYTVLPEQFGIERAAVDELRGGEPDENAAIIRAVLNGVPGPKRDVVVLNAAAAIYAGGRADTFAAGIERARRSIDSGAARGKLEALAQASRARDAKGTTAC